MSQPTKLSQRLKALGIDADDYGPVHQAEMLERRLEALEAQASAAHPPAGPIVTHKDGKCVGCRGDVQELLNAEKEKHHR